MAVCATPGLVVVRVADRFGLSPELILSKDRTAPYAWARHCAMYLIHAHWGYSYPFVGRLFGRDHTTVIAAVRRVRQAADLHLSLAEWLASEMMFLDAGS